MKITNRPARTSPIVISLLALVMLALCTAWLAPAAPALAAAGTPQPRATADGTRLKDAYAREQKALAAQTDNLAKAGETATNVQGQIDMQKAKGTNTSALEAALTAYKAKVAAAQSAHDTAAGILGPHAGFDADGNVTDIAQARQTLTSARQSLGEARASLLQARQGLQAAQKAFQAQLAPSRLAREQELLAKQQTRLDNTAQIVQKAQAIIATLQAQGKDTAPLETALAVYQQQVATAQASHNTAADILSAHAGFDAAGLVNDPELARQTLMSAQEALSTAHKILRQATQDARAALQAYRDAHEPVAKPRPAP